MTTDTATPLIHYDAMSRASWRRFRAPVDGHLVAVSEERGGTLQQVTRKLSASETFYSPPSGVYWVDVSVHHVTTSMELPTAEGVFAFTAKLDIAWRVGDPVQAVRANLTGGEHLYRPYLEHELRPISRQFAADEFAEAEQRINDHLGNAPVELGCGVRLLTCLVRLAPETSTQAHLRLRTFDRHQEERREAEHRARIQSTSIDREVNESDHSLALQSTNFDHEIAKLRQQHEFELERQRMSFYADALQAGDVGMLALRLSSGRADVDEVIQLLMERKRIDVDGARQMLNSLLEQRLVTKRDVQDITTQATSVLADHWNLAAPPTASAAPELVELSKSSVADAELVDEQDEDDDDDD